MENQVQLSTVKPMTTFEKVKEVAKPFAYPATVVGLYVVSNTAFAADPDFDSLAESAKELMKKALAGALGVLALGVTIVGSFKGYGLLKNGINRA